MRPTMSIRRIVSRTAIQPLWAHLLRRKPGHATGNERTARPQDNRGRAEAGAKAQRVRLRPKARGRLSRRAY